MRERKKIQDEARKNVTPLSNEQIRAMMPLGKDYITEDSGAAPGKVRDILMPHNANGNIERGPLGHVEWTRTRELLANETSDSARQIQRYIRLTELVEPLRDKVDDGQIALRPAVELSYLTPTEQTQLNEFIEMEQATPTHAQAIRIRKMSAEGSLTEDALESIMLEKKPNQKERVVLRGDRITKLFPKNLPATKREDYVIAAMEHYSKFLTRKERDQER